MYINFIYIYLYNMKFESMLIGLGTGLLVSYCVTQLLTFYGIGVNVYGSYLGFYAFLLLSTYVLPTSYPTLLLNTD